MPGGKRLLFIKLSALFCVKILRVNSNCCYLDIRRFLFIPFNCWVFNWHLYRIGLQLNFKIEASVLASQMFGDCLSQIIAFISSIFGIEAFTSGMGNHRKFYGLIA